MSRGLTVMRVQRPLISQAHDSGSNRDTWLPGDREFAGDDRFKHTVCNSRVSARVEAYQLILDVVTGSPCAGTTPLMLHDAFSAAAWGHVRV